MRYEDSAAINRPSLSHIQYKRFLWLEEGVDALHAVACGHLCLGRIWRYKLQQVHSQVRPLRLHRQPDDSKAGVLPVQGTRLPVHPAHMQ